MDKHLWQGHFVLCTQCLSRFLITLHLLISGTLLMNEIPLNEPRTEWLLLKRRRGVYHGILKQNDLQTRRNFRTKYGRDSPSRSSIRARDRDSLETKNICGKAFDHSPIKSIRTAPGQLQLPRSTVHKVLHNNLRLHAYKIQLLQAL